MHYHAMGFWLGGLDYSVPACWMVSGHSWADNPGLCPTGTCTNSPKEVASVNSAAGLKGDLGDPLNCPYALVFLWVSVKWASQQY